MVCLPGARYWPSVFAVDSPQPQAASRTSRTRVFDKLDDVPFDIRVEDQDHSARLLRGGS